MVKTLAVQENQKQIKPGFLSVLFGAEIMKKNLGEHSFAGKSTSAYAKQPEAREKKESASKHLTAFLRNMDKEVPLTKLLKTEYNQVLLAIDDLTNSKRIEDVNTRLALLKNKIDRIKAASDELARLRRELIFMVKPVGDKSIVAGDVVVTNDEMTALVFQAGGIRDMHNKLSRIQELMFENAKNASEKNIRFKKLGSYLIDEQSFFELTRFREILCNVDKHNELLMAKFNN
jgi:hypothetical protein